MIIVINAAIYSINNGTEMAYAVQYSDSQEFRTIQTSTNWIRNEYKKNGVWVECGKPYVVKKNKIRQGERMIETVKKFLAA